MDDNKATQKPPFLKRKAALKVTFCVKKTRDASYKKISAILRKAENDRTEEELQYLCSGDNIVQEVKEKLLKRQRIKERLQEFEDPADILNDKCALLAKAISESKHLVIYTGAGISTAARIPDYRGTNGVWTLLEQGKDIGLHDLSAAKPTLTHMALFKLYQEGILKHIVSQNCDGLHLRSGLPRSALSEIHGNMYLEVCHDCEPIRFYLRLFDVTQHTARYSHETLRLCYYCGSPLCDTIVHFGERGVLQWPLNWKTASDNANKADMILCLGSSLKVLKKYPWLWGMDKPLRKRPQLFIVNLQWTPKDEHATLKINGKCDAVLAKVMSSLSLEIPRYSRQLDPIYNHATLIYPEESHTTSKPSLKAPQNPADSTHDNQKMAHHSSLSPPHNVVENKELEMEKLAPVLGKVKLESLMGEEGKEGMDGCHTNLMLMNSVFLNDSECCVKEEVEEYSVESDPLQNEERKANSVNGEICRRIVKEATQESFSETDPLENKEQNVRSTSNDEINRAIVKEEVKSDSGESDLFTNAEQKFKSILNGEIKLGKIVKEEIKGKAVFSNSLQNDEEKVGTILNGEMKLSQVAKAGVEGDSVGRNQFQSRERRLNSIILSENSNFSVIGNDELVESSFAEITLSHNGEEKVMNSIILNETNFRTANCGERDAVHSSGRQVLNGIIIDNGMNFCEIMEHAESLEEDLEETDPLQLGGPSGEVIFNCELMDFSSVDLALGAVETVGISIPPDFDQVYWRIHDNLVETSKVVNNGWLGDSFKDKSVILGTCDTQTQDTHLTMKTDSYNDNELVSPQVDKAIGSQHCHFCQNHYGSPSCLFYLKFTNINPNFKDRCCLCCENAEASIAKERTNSQQSSINPGWFGKGYRKKIRKKKRE